jgi:hypothetical protein
MRAKRIRVSAADIARAARIAKEFGVTVRLDVDGSVTISPASSIIEADLDRELAAFEAKHGRPLSSEASWLLEEHFDRKYAPKTRRSGTPPKGDS